MRGGAARAAALFAAALSFALVADDARALLLGENAKGAPTTTLKSALDAARRGRAADEIWRTKRWYCPTGRRGECRWELPAACIRPQLINLVALRHTSFTGGVRLSRVFSASCVWRQYPQLRDKVRIYQGECNGAFGFANHKGEICINMKKLKGDYQCDARGRCGEGIVKIHRVILHEVQHQIQFIEKWPRSSVKCPYRRRAVEAEAFYVAERAGWSRRRQLQTAPAWHRAGLC